MSRNGMPCTCWNPSCGWRDPGGALPGDRGDPYNGGIAVRPGPGEMR